MVELENAGSNPPLHQVPILDKSKTCSSSCMDAFSVFGTALYMGRKVNMILADIKDRLECNNVAACAGVSLHP